MSNLNIFNILKSLLPLKIFSKIVNFSGRRMYDTRNLLILHLVINFSAVLSIHKSIVVTCHQSFLLAHSMPVVSWLSGSIQFSELFYN